jgi:serine O-acetyltransferase
MNFVKTLSNKELAEYICSQLNNFFPDKDKLTSTALKALVDNTEEIAYKCFSQIPKKYFCENNQVFFNHLQSDQYAMYLCMLSRNASLFNANSSLASKIYYLNKALHSIDVYFRTELPEVFLFVHPLGSILGRAKFSDYFIMYQNCTVGCLNEGIFPTFTGKVILYANSSVLGNCNVGDNVCIASGTSLINTNVPDNTIVLGDYPNYIFKENNKDFFKRPPFYYDNE